MIQRRLLGIALSVLGILSACPSIAHADFANDFANDLVFSIPEPSTLALISTGVAALAGIGWFRRRK